MDSNVLSIDDFPVLLLVLNYLQLRFLFRGRNRPFSACSSEKTSEDYWFNSTDELCIWLVKNLRGRRFRILRWIWLCIFSWICNCFHRYYILRGSNIKLILVVIINFFNFKWSIWKRISSSVSFWYDGLIDFLEKVGSFEYRHFHYSVRELFKQLFAENEMNVFSNCCICKCSSKNQERKGKIRWGYEALTLKACVQPKCLWQKTGSCLKLCSTKRLLSEFKQWFQSRNF